MHNKLTEKKSLMQSITLFSPAITSSSLTATGCVIKLWQHWYTQPNTCTHWNGVWAHTMLASPSLFVVKPSTCTHFNTSHSGSLGGILASPLVHASHSKSQRSVISLLVSVVCKCLPTFWRHAKVGMGHWAWTIKPCSILPTYDMHVHKL